MDVKTVKYKPLTRLEKVLAFATNCEQFLVEAKSKRPVFAFQIQEWKRRLLRRAYPDLAFYFVPMKRSAWEMQPLISLVRDPALLVWGYRESPATRGYASMRRMPLWRLEDGFIRSIGLGITGARPISTVLDESGHLHFDARGPSQLEQLLANHDFASDPALLERARACLTRLRETGISKYNPESASETDASHPWFRPTGKKRIVALGQVESDASLLYGAPKGADNGSLVWEARRRNPDAEIFFRPHPDLTINPDKMATPLGDIACVAHVLPGSVSLRQSLSEADEIYTMTSLAGFEALWYGKRVVTLGTPFYAGWGLTEDLHPIKRRKRRLTLEEAFAAAYLLYPRYHNPFSGEPLRLEEALDLIQLGLKLRAELTPEPAQPVSLGVPQSRRRG